ncbi:MAG TPA: hypothetical protein VFP84_30250 [Kofleriaceae bacterium]|nr:hypothetical protein [Kofleriaceae bacterium]
MGRLREASRLLGALVIGILFLVAAGLVWFRVLDKGKYGTDCEYSLACRSMACLHHALRGEAQVTAAGVCTRSCATDAECDGGLRCVALSDASLDDLPPVFRPVRACMRVEPLPATR